MTDEQTSAERAEDRRSELNDLLSKKWFLLDQPWVASDLSCTAILAGSADPHLGAVVADTMINDDMELHEQQAIAQHIVELHNSSLQVG